MTELAVGGIDEILREALLVWMSPLVAALPSMNQKVSASFRKTQCDRSANATGCASHHNAFITEFGRGRWMNRHRFLGLFLLRQDNL